MDRIMCRDQYGGVRFRPGKGTLDALQAIKDLQDHPRYGKWARRAVDRDSKGQSRLRPPELDIIRVTDRLYEIEDHIHGPLVVPVETIPEPSRTKRCHQCSRFHRSGNTNWGVCQIDGGLKANLAAACVQFKRREIT